MDGIWKGVDPYIFRRSCQFLQDKFSDLSTPSIRKVYDEGKKLGKPGGKENNDGNNSH